MNRLMYLLVFSIVLPLSSMADDPTKARIITGNERLTQCISPVHIQQVDGKQRQLPKLGFELDPGTHSLQGTAELNLTYCHAPREAGATNTPPLTAIFEAGKIYYIGLDHSSRDREEWKFVVWKVEDMTG